MKIKYLFIANSVVLLMHGLGFLLMPDITMSYYGVTLAAGGILVARWLGGVQLGNALLTWLTRNEPASTARQAIVTALFFAWTVAFIAGLLAQFAGTMNGLGWSSVAISLALMLGFGYFRLGAAR
jgi:hypothetical protein